MLVGGVVGHQVDDDLEPEVVGGGEQRVGVVEGAEERVDVAVVGDVVAVVVLRRGVERRDPHGVDAEVAQVGQPAGDAGQVADAGAATARAGRGEAADVDLVDDGVAPPLGGVTGSGCSREVLRVDGDPDVLGEPSTRPSAA